MEGSRKATKFSHLLFLMPQGQRLPLPRSDFWETQKRLIGRRCKRPIARQNCDRVDNSTAPYSLLAPRGVHQGKPARHWQ